VNRTRLSSSPVGLTAGRLPAQGIYHAVPPPGCA